MQKKKILIFQRVLTSYRLELLKELCSKFDQVSIVTSQGEDRGTLKKVRYNEMVLPRNLSIHEFKAIKIGYTGESRSTSLFLYPQAIKLIRRYDVLLLEGTTNIINNSYIIPIARLLGKKVVWWDSGYSEEVRTTRRKVMDFLLYPFVWLTTDQMSYSSKGKQYLRDHMGARNVFLNLNTINTSYFKNIQDEINHSIDNHIFDASRIKLLYVGVVEQRKKVEELIQVVINLNKVSIDRNYDLRIIGGGNQLEELKEAYSSKEIVFYGPIYDKFKLKKHYFDCDLFVLPGDGGLGILQSLLYGLPVLCLKGADGTELDYILEKKYLLNNFGEVEDFLKSLKIINRSVYKNYSDHVSSEKWIKRFIERIK